MRGRPRTVSGVVLIDLDTPGTAPSPSVRRPVRPGGPGGRWWALALALALVVLATLDQRPVPDLRPIAALPAGINQVVTTGDAFYVLRSDGHQGWQVGARAWSDGTERWHRPVAGPDPGMATAGAAVFLTHQQCTSLAPPGVERIDPATGRTLWQAAGNIVAFRDVLLLAPPGRCGPVRELSAVSLTDGRPRWTIRFPQPRMIVPGLDWFAAFDAQDGATDTYTTTTGAHLATGTIPAGAGTIPWGGWIESGGGATTAGDTLVVAIDRRLSTFDRRTLASGWTGDLDTAPSALQECGALLCVTENGTLSAVDPVLGELRWQHPVLSPNAAGPRYLTGFTDHGIRILGLSDGRVAADLPDWQLCQGDGTGRTEVVLQHESDGRVVIALASLATGTVRTLGRVAGFQGLCIAGPQRLLSIDPVGVTLLLRP